MEYITPAFKGVCVTFACLAVATGTQAVWDPVRFSKSFGLDLEPFAPAPDSKAATAAYFVHKPRNLAKSYAALMGARQLGTGITLLTFAYQGKWNEAATFLAIIGIVVAGADGFFLAKYNTLSSGLFHIIPGASIAALAAAAIYVGA